MNSRLSRIALAVTASLVVATNASAQMLTISADFNGKLFGTPGPNYSGQAGNPSAGTSWNDIQFPGQGDASAPTFTTTALIGSDGTTATPITLTLNNPYNYNAESFGQNPNVANNAHALLGDWIDGGGNGNSVIINNLVPNATYSLYLYGTGVNNPGNGSGSGFTVGGVTRNTFNPGGDHALTVDVDYTIFQSVMADAAGSIQVDYTRQFAGLQVTAVPEPSTVAVLSLVGVAFFGCAVRRRLTNSSAL